MGEGVASGWEWSSLRAWVHYAILLRIQPFFTPLQHELYVWKRKRLTFFIASFPSLNFDNEVGGWVKFKGAKILAYLTGCGKFTAGSEDKRGDAIETRVEMLYGFPLFNLKRLELLIGGVAFIIILRGASASEKVEGLKAVVCAGFIEEL